MLFVSLYFTDNFVIIFVIYTWFFKNFILFVVSTEFCLYLCFIYYILFILVINHGFLPDSVFVYIFFICEN